MIKVFDRIKELSTTTGVDTFKLEGATFGYSSFNSYYNSGELCFYAAVQDNVYEVGSGEYYFDGSYGWLTRNVLQSTNANNPVSFDYGVKEVFVTYPAKHSVYSEELMPSGSIAIWTGPNTLSYASGNLSSTQFIFPNDLTVSLTAPKTFGKYGNGDVIPASGKTTAEVIQMAIVEALAPTTTFTTASTVAFNQTSINNTLNFSYIINSLGASVATVSLEWRRNNAGAWTELTNSQATPSSYTHSMTDTNYNTQVFNYRYTVTDTVGGTLQRTVNITPAAYVNPSISLTVAAVLATSPETNATRERGNVNSNLSGTVTRNTPNVNLVDYTLQYQVNGGSWLDVGSAVGIGPGTTAIGLTNHNPVASSASATTIGYRVKVVDAYLQSIASQVYSSTSTVSLYYMIFHGPASSAPINSANVRALGFKQLTNGSNPFNLNTGTVEKIFTVAMPNTLAVSNVTDLDALNANITANYINNPFNVNDSGNNSVSYNVYTMTNAIPYGENHRHQVTRV